MDGRWFVWLPKKNKKVVFSSEIEARDFAEEFGGEMFEMRA